MLTISGAYGRDYKSKAAIENDLRAGKDFIVRGWQDDGRYINLPEMATWRQVCVRYKADRSVCVIDLTKLQP